MKPNSRKIKRLETTRKVSLHDLCTDDVADQFETVAPPKKVEPESRKWWDPSFWFRKFQKLFCLRLLSCGPTGITNPVETAAIIQYLQQNQDDSQTMVSLSLSAPSQVAPGKEFPVKIGSMSSESKVHLVVHRMEANEWSHTLLENEHTFRLVAKLPEGEEERSRVIAFTSARGQLQGMVSHNITVRLGSTHEISATSASKLFPFHDDEKYKADLTVVITHPSDKLEEGAYNWSFISPRIACPDKPCFPAKLLKNTETWTTEFIRQINQYQNSPLITHVLKSGGMRIADHVPEEFFQLLRQVSEQVQPMENRVPSLLLYSEEQYIPWELMWLEEPLYPDRPHYLGAQIHVGRWIADGPFPHPKRQVTVKKMVVMSGEYNEISGLIPLKRAAEEADELETKYDAQHLLVNDENLKRLLDGRFDPKGEPGGAQAIHIACHGNDRGAIRLNVDKHLSPFIFESARHWASKEGPFLFLNGCNLGQTGEILGDCGGFAGSSLRAGFSAFLAPLWEVEDETAKRFALEFYDLALNAEESAEGWSSRTTSEILRELRNKYQDCAPNAAYLAYVFYGHPHLRLYRPKPIALKYQNLKQRQFSWAKAVSPPSSPDEPKREEIAPPPPDGLR